MKNTLAAILATLIVTSAVPATASLKSGEAEMNGGRATQAQSLESGEQVASGKYENDDDGDRGRKHSDRDHKRRSHDDDHKSGRSHHGRNHS